MKSVKKVLLFIWLVCIILEAPLRYYTVALGLPGFIYLRDIILGFIFLYFLLSTIRRGRISGLLLMILAAVVYGALIGILNGLSFSQVAFGSKMFLPFIVAFIAVYYMQVEKDFLRLLFRWLTPIVLIGIFLELYRELPWKGVQYAAFGVDIDASREWTTLGLPRLSGFGRASYETAAILFALMAMYLTVSIISRASSKKPILIYYDNLMLALCVAGIVLTTSKTAILSAIGLLICIIILGRIHNSRKFGKVLSLGLRMLIILFALYGMAPPIIAAVSPSFFSHVLDSDDLIWRALTFSFMERMETTWPDAFRLLDHGWKFLTGRGIGGIGAAQFYFEPALYNPADNLYVYLQVSFGIVFTAFLILCLIGYLLLVKVTETSSPFFFLFSFTIFAFGATMNIVESPILMFSLGILIGHWKHDAISLH